MPRFNDSQRLFVYDLKVRAIPYHQIVLRFTDQFPGVNAPNRSTVLNIYKKMQVYKVLADRHKGNSGPLKTGRSDENILAVYESYMNDPKMSIRKRERTLRLSKSTIHRILRKDLGLYPYRISNRHAMLARDYPVRLQFAGWFLGRHHADDEFVNNIWWSDESHIHLSGDINSHNAIHWGSERPVEVNPVMPHSLKITVWCAISSHGILGPYLFEENGVPVTVNSERYLHMLRRQFIPDLFALCTAKDLDPQDMFFMQDGARPHITVPVRAYLQEQFGDRTIGERLQHHWPARSPDLTPCDYFLWGFMKDEVFSRLPITTREGLEGAVREILAELDDDTCKRACNNIVKRLEVLQHRNGEHIEQLL